MKDLKRIDFDRGFLDVVLAVGLCTVMMLTMALQILNPKVNNVGNVKKEADFVIEMEYPGDINCDVDLWVQDPMEKVVFFAAKEAPLMHLERDDLGNSSDTLIIQDGTRIFVNENKEFTTLRGTITGEYVVNIHLYACRDNLGDKTPLGTEINVPVKISLIQVNPLYAKVFNREVILTRVWEERTAFTFQINDKKNAHSFQSDVEIGLLEKTIRERNAP